jgi:hypothetical protein
MHMRSRSRIVSAVLMLLLVPAFAQVLSAQMLLRCADGRECFGPVVQKECEKKSTCCHSEPAPARPKALRDRGSRCIWTLVPGLDLNHTIYRSPIETPALLAIAHNDLLAAITPHRSQCFGSAFEHVPIVHQLEPAPAEGVGPRSPPVSASNV